MPLYVFGRNCIFHAEKINLDNDILYLITLVIILVRLMAVKFKWYLPTFRKKLASSLSN
jgi:uncharacterized membrane protein YeiH